MKRILAGIVFMAMCLTTHAQGKKVTVAADGSGDFKTIQAAVNALPDHAQVRLTIFVKNGTYAEKLVIPSWKTKITLIGEDKDKTIITWNDYSGKEVNGVKLSTFTSYTVLVQGNDFHAENITFENSAGTGVGQAVALHVEADRCIFKNCKLIANQDTLYTGVDNSR
ncbi:MAG TPA: pectinesterase family protein, partial [Cyclobacteriaceae bacterium]|nr:pectinesterase family protein [Cyclobacteriaceae bacterium]